MAERHERAWAKRSHASLCVSAAMQAELRRGWGVRATLCYDRPPPHFRPTGLEEAHELLAALQPVLAAPLHPRDCVAAMYDGSGNGRDGEVWHTSYFVAMCSVCVRQFSGLLWSFQCICPLTPAKLHTRRHCSCASHVLVSTEICEV